MRKKEFIFFLVLLSLCLFVCGCQPGQKGGREINCPGKPSIEEAIRVIQLQQQNLLPFQASAECVITYRDVDGGERREPIRGARMAFVPDDKVYFKGELVFKELRFGTNETEFWLRVKADLEDLGDSYWWGFRADVKRCPQTLPVNPDGIAEALGTVKITPDWEMLNRGGYDIFTLYDSDRIQKRVYINTCDYHIEVIEYFDSNALRRVSVKLKDYSTRENGILVPTQIEVISYDEMGQPELKVTFGLKNIQLLPVEKQGKKLFLRPDRDGFGHLYRLNENCEFIEE